MRILLNGAWRELAAGAAGAADGAGPAVSVADATGAAATALTAHAVGAPTLAAMLQVCGYGGATVATAVNGEFVPAGARGEVQLREGDRVEVLAPMQGG